MKQFPARKKQLELPAPRHPLVEKFLSFINNPKIAAVIILLVFLIPVVVFRQDIYNLILTKLSAKPAFRFAHTNANTGYSLENENKQGGFKVLLVNEKKPTSPEAKFVVDNTSVDFSLSSILSKNSYKIENRNNKDIVIWKDVLLDTDLEYEMQEFGLKESIVLKSNKLAAQNQNNDIITLSFALNLNGVIPRKDLWGNLSPVFVDEKTGGYKFHFDHPYMIDAKGVRNEALSFEIIQTKTETRSQKSEQKKLIKETFAADNDINIQNNISNYLLKLKVPKNWLVELKRAYPVIIDPTVTHNTSALFAGTGSIFQRVQDGGSGVSPIIRSKYHELPVDSSTIGLWHMNEGSGNALDSSGYGNTGTLSGSTLPTWTTPSGMSLGNSSLTFNGSTAFLEVSNPNSFNFDRDFTVEAWIKRATMGSGLQHAIISKATGNTWVAGNKIFSVYQDKLNFNQYGLSTIQSSQLIDTDWHYAAIVSSSGSIFMYIDGKLDGYSRNYGIAADNNNDNVRIAQSNGGNFFNGSMDEIRFSKTAKTQEEIRSAYTRFIYALYTSPVMDMASDATWSSFTWTAKQVRTGDGENPISSSNLVAKWDLNETSGTTAVSGGSCGASCNGTLTNFSTTSSQDQGISGWTKINRRWGPGALTFLSSSSNTVAISGNPAALGFERTNAFTISAWIKVHYSANSQEIFSKLNSASPYNGYEFHVFTDGTIRLILINNNTNNMIDVRSRSSVVDGQWHYVVATYDGSSAAAGVNLYIDGIAENNIVTNNLSATITNAIVPQIGSRNNASSYFNGVIDSLMIFNRALTVAEIRSNSQAAQLEIQARASTDNSTWDPWTSVANETQIDSMDQGYLYKTTDDGLSSYWPLDANANDIKGGRNGTLNGTSTVFGKYSQAKYFTPASNDAITFTNSSVGTDYTITSWVKFPIASSANWRTLFANNGGTYHYALVVANGPYLGVYNGAWYSCNWDTTSVSGWHQLSLVVSSSQTYTQFYLDGAPLCQSATKITNQNFGIIGNCSTACAQGAGTAIDEVRFFSKALTQSQIAQYAAEGNSYANQINQKADTTTKAEGTGSEKFTAGMFNSDTNLRGFWHLDETSGNANDSSGLSNTLTAQNTPGVANGMLGKARTFNGSNQGFTCTDAACGGTSKLDSTGTNLSMGAWINSTNVNTNYQMILEKSDGTTGAGNAYELRFYGNTGRIEYVGYIAGAYRSAAGATVLKNNTWYYVAATYDGTAMRVYVNGVLDGITIIPGVLSDSAADFYIGRRVDGWYFNGTIDEAFVAMKTFSDEEIAEGYRNGRDHYINKTVSADLSGSQKMGFNIAADRPGKYLEAIIGKNNFVNYQSDANTVGLWHLDDNQKLIWNDTFIGTSINTSKWIEIDPNSDKISQNNGIVLSAGTVNAWDAGIISQQVFSNQSGNTLYAKLTTGASNASMMIGWGQNQTSSASYATLTHGLYFESSSLLKVYQDGAYIGQYGSGFATSTTYEVMITINPSGTASYQIKGGAYTSWTTLLAADNAKTAVSLRAQVAQYRTSATVNEIRITAPGVKDTSGYNNSGFINGPYISSNYSTFAQGRIGKARTFNGSSDYIRVSNNSQLNICGTGSQVTVDFWLYVTTLSPTWQSLMGKGDLNSSGCGATGCSDRQYHMSLYTDGSVWFAGTSINNIGSTHTATGSTPKITTNRWYHVAGIIDSVAQTLNIYINGMWAGGTSFNSSGIRCGAGDLFFGAEAPGATALNGMIDEFRISNTARSPDYLRQVFEIGSRTHPINIDFVTKPQAAYSSGTSVTILNPYNTGALTDTLSVGDTIVFKENVAGTETVGQATVTAITNTSSTYGTVTVASAPSFPAGGYTTNAIVYKWQRELFDVTGSKCTNTTQAGMCDRKNVNLVTIRVNDGSQGVNFWLDDLDNISNYSTFTDPGAVSGLKMWLKADSITGVSDGGAVASWSDISGNGNNLTQATANRQPVLKNSIINGKPVVRFTAASTHQLTNATNFTPPVTVIYVGRQNGGTNARVMTAVNNNWLLGYWSGSRRQAYFNGWVSAVGGVTTDTNWHIYSGVNTGSLSSVYEDGVMYASNGNGIAGPNGLAIGCWSSVSECSDADVAEVLVFSSALSGGDRERIEQYLATKYNLYGSNGTQYYSLDSFDTATGIGTYSINIIPTNVKRYLQYRAVYTSLDSYSALLLSTGTNYLNKHKPNAPAISVPAAGTKYVNVDNAQFQLAATSPDGSTLQYKLEFALDSNFTNIVKTVIPNDAGWTGGANYKYASGATATYTMPTQNPLADNTTYYVRAYAYDPDGAVAWSTTPSSTINFTTVTNCTPGLETDQYTGSAYITKSCSFSRAVDGVDAGTGTTNTATITVDNNAVLSLTSGQKIVAKSITLKNGGKVVVGSGQLLIGGDVTLWNLDSDSDGWGNTVQTSVAVRGGVQSNSTRRGKLTSISTPDCNDSVNSVGNSCGFGNCSDGNKTVSGTEYTDSVKTAVNSASGSVINVSSTSGFAANQEILIIQMYGAESSGNYELNTISSLGNGVLNLVSPLSYTYGTGAQVMRVYNWNSVTVPNSATLTASAWNGTVGGVVAFRSCGAVTVNTGGTITANNLGFAGGGGGAGGSGGAPSNTPGAGGNGGGVWDGYTCGNNNGSNGTNASQGGGSGGSAGQTNGCMTGGTGGSGGQTGYAGQSGTTGSTAFGPGGGQTSSGGVNTSTTSTDGYTSIFAGGSGGGGTGGTGGSGSGAGGGGGGESGGVSCSGATGAGGSAGNTGSTGGAGGAGGIGGGIIIIYADSFSNSGTIGANGQNGSAGSGGSAGAAGGGGGPGGSSACSQGQDGGAGGAGATGSASSGGSGGGGGAGGSIHIKTNGAAALGTSLITATGGSGGSPSGTSGSAGKIKVNAGSVTGSTNPPYN